MKQFIKKVQSLAFAASLLLSVGVSATQSVSAATAPSMTTNFVSTGKVSLTFDDGLTSALLAAQTLQPFGYAGTDYVISGCVGMATVPNACAADGNTTYMTWNDIKTLHDTYGWEIGSHTQTHPQLATDKLTAQQLMDQLQGSKTAIKTNTGFDATEFADPYGDYDNNTIAQIAKYYGSHRTFQDYTLPDATEPITDTFPYYSPRSGCAAYNVTTNTGGTCYNDYMLTVAAVQGDVPVATVKTMIDTAKANGQWLVLVFHHIVQGTASTVREDYQYSTTQLAEVAQYLKDTSTPVTSVANGRATSNTNLFTNANFDTSLSTAASAQDAAADGVWSTRYPASVKQDTANNGSYPSPTNSVALTAAASDVELFSHKVAVDPTQQYLIKNFVNAKDLTAGRVFFYVDEYDANGTWISGQNNNAWAIVSDGTALQARTGSVNMVYKPTSAAVAKIRLQVVVGATAGVTAAKGVVYYDSPQMMSFTDIGNDRNGTATPPVVTPPTTGKTGDVNGDGAINLNDLSIVSSNWNKTGMTAGQGDLNGDGAVNLNDLSILSSNWGK